MDDSQKIVEVRLPPQIVPTIEIRERELNVEKTIEIVEE